VCGGDLKDKETFRCKECNNIHIARTRTQSLRNRKIVIAHYGGKCDCCCETTYEFLEIDHINGGGTKHRREVVGSHIITWIIKNNYPDSFRVLCANCNRNIARYGICPHKQEPQLPKSIAGKKARRQRLQAIAHYGGKCACCGEQHWAFLEFDHIDNNGSEHRKIIKKIDAKWIIQNNYPDYLQLLCANCNKAKKASTEPATCIRWPVNN